jgi:putative transposase
MIPNSALWETMNPASSTGRSGPSPRSPEGRGKIERFFRTVRDQFLVEIAGSPAGGDTPAPSDTQRPSAAAGRRVVGSLDELNRLFQAWVEQVYHRTVHSETGMAPLARYLAGGPLRYVSSDDLTDAFRWSVHRKVTRTGLVSLHGNRYQVEAHLADSTVELVFDPFDLATLTVRVGGVDVGTATPFVLTRHSHPKARPEDPATPARPTGINYLALIDTQRTTTLGQKINYAALIDRLTSPDNPT